MSIPRQQLEAWLKQIQVEGGDVLDIGGSQYPVKGRTGSWKPSNYDILDLVRPHEIKVRPDIVADIQTQKKEHFPRQGYDTVFCLEVMEYVWDPMTTCRNIAQTVRQGGTLYISFPFVYPNHKPYGADMLRYTENAARRLLTEAGFDVIEIRPRVHSSPQVLRAAYATDAMRGIQDDSLDHTGYLVTARKL